MATQPALSDVIESITSDVKTIVKGEIELAKAEMVPQVKSVGVGAGLFGAAGYLGLQAATLIFVALGFLISQFFLGLMAPGFAYASGFGVLALLLLIVAGILALIGKGKFNVHGPDRTIAQADQAVSDVQTAVSRGQANVASLTVGNAREVEAPPIR